MMNEKEQTIASIWNLQSDMTDIATYRMGWDYQKAHDVVGNAIIKAVENVDKYDGSKGTVRNWLWSLVMRSCLDNVRSHAVSRTVSTGDTVFLENIGGSYDVDYDGVSVSTTDFWREVALLVNNREYGVLVRRFRDDMSYADIAEIEGIPKGSVMSALFNAKKKLRNSPRFGSIFDLD